MTTTHSLRIVARRLGWLVAGCMALVTPWSGAADPAPAVKARPALVQRTFGSADDAARALADAMRADDRQQTRQILGPGASRLLRSGDPVQDDDARQAFVAGYDQSVKLEGQSDGRMLLLIGPDDFPFPYPLVAEDGRWHFDAKRGNTEVLDRRIGRNELSAILVCLAYVDAQREYATRDRDANGLLEYAQKLTSSPGTRDGLYWEAKEGEPPSPMGPLVARARGQGYGHGASDAPYHGYLYKILKGQGKDAPGGAYDYLVDGRMIGGFGLVAYPARWGHSGVMTFICNHDGVVYERNLGRDTQAIASPMTLFDPGTGWVRSKDQ